MRDDDGYDDGYDDDRWPYLISGTINHKPALREKSPIYEQRDLEVLSVHDPKELKELNINKAPFNEVEVVGLLSLSYPKLEHLQLSKYFIY